MGAQFPCKQCGALLTYKVGSDLLVCDYCSFKNPIPVSDQTVEERDFHQTLKALSQRSLTEEHFTCSCKGCGAEFTLSVNEHAGECPFCGTDVVAETGTSRHIKPWGLLPFRVERAEARERFRGWLKRLWFAPGKLKKYARLQDKLVGMYLPYWTFDSQSMSIYHGMRGTIYYEPVQYTVVVDGRTEVRTRMVARTRWREVNGEVRRMFDDVPIPASHSLPEKVRYRLTDWDFGQLKPYQEAYLSGFRSEIYQTDLDKGFIEARAFMDRVIQNDIRRDIGGDRQRILNYHTDHRHITFKHVLVPVWLAAFRFQNKSYRFAINGRSGAVYGERPYSAWKITLTVLAVLAIVLLVVLLSEGRVDWQRLIEVWLGTY